MSNAHYTHRVNMEFWCINEIDENLFRVQNSLTIPNLKKKHKKQRTESKHSHLCIIDLKNIATFCRKGYNDTAQYRTETALLLASLECRYFMDCISFRRQHGSFGPFSFEIASNHSYQQMKKKWKYFKFVFRWTRAKLNGVYFWIEIAIRQEIDSE